MPAAAGAHRGRSASTGTLLALGAGLALYQMTSLVLGPGGSRQLPLSLTIPAVDAEELSQPAVSNADLIIGTLAAPTGPVVASPATSHRPIGAPSRRPSATAPVSQRGSTPGAASTPTPITVLAPSPTPAPQPPLRPMPLSLSYAQLAPSSD